MSRPSSLHRAIVLAVLVSSGGAQPCATQAQPTPAEDSRGAVFNVRDFGAAGDGHTGDTAALQRAIDAASAHSGTLRVPAGVYVIGTVELRSHMTLLLQHGAVLQGSPRIADYGTIAQYGLDHRYAINSSGEGDLVGMLIARDVEDIRIEGDGTIDGVGESFFDPATPHVGIDFDAGSTRNPDAFVKDLYRIDDGPLEVRATGRPGTMVQFHRVRNVTVEGVTLRNAPNWTLHLQHANHVTVRALRVDNDQRIPNNDGLDCMDCRDLRVSDSSFTAGDDDFAIVGSSDVAITNCTLNSYSAAVRFEDSANSVFSNLVIHANRGIGIFAREGTQTRNALFQNIVIETRLKHGHWWGKGEPIYIASSIMPGNGSVENVRFSDIVADTEGGILLEATNPGSVRDITLRNVSMRMHMPLKDLAESEGGNFDLRWTAKSLAEAVVRHDTPAVYAHNIDTLTVDGLDVTWPSPPGPRNKPVFWPEYFSGAFEAHNFDRVTLDRVHAASAPYSFHPVITLDHGFAASIRNSESSDASQTLVQTTALGTPLFVSGNRRTKYARARRR